MRRASPTSARDGGELALGDWQGVEMRLEIERNAEFGQCSLGCLAHRAIVHQLRSAAEQRIDRDVFGDGHFGK